MHLTEIEREISHLEAVANIKHWFSHHDVSNALSPPDMTIKPRLDPAEAVEDVLTLFAGKGSWAEADVYFEVFKHLLLEAQFISSDSTILPLRSWIKSAELHPDCLFSQILQEYDDGPLQYWRYKSLYTSDTFLIPEVLVNPFHSPPLIKTEAFDFLENYNSHCGWAAGSTFREALLHGANQIIEQHYISQMYKQYIDFSEYSGEFYMINLPDETKSNYFDSVVNVESLDVVMCETTFGSYFCFCSVQSPLSPMTFRASSVSYDKRHAVNKALSRLEKKLAHFDGNALSQDLKALNLLTKHERLRPIITLARMDRLPTLNFTDLAYSSSASESATFNSFDRHFYKLRNGLESHGYDLLFNTAFQHGDLWLVSTYIPGLERFNQIDKGKWVVPLGQR
ncbi:YcaO-like family protein [Vibrio ostreicida]|uniref:YcaO-like family protein n=1 Tax=Vibrio ostreicida TaxID=526588 RepID=UPI000970E6EA|nr:YcaO-like family protein [Vibrio ostreicida]